MTQAVPGTEDGTPESIDETGLREDSFDVTGIQPRGRDANSGPEKRGKCCIFILYT